VLVEFGIDSDFVTKTAEFLQLSKNIAMHIAGMNPVNVEELLEQRFAMDDTRTVKDVLEQAQQHFKENIVVTRFVRWDGEPPDEQHRPPPTGPAAVVRQRGR
jgi:translation elongation factor EF-Ts